MSYSPDLAAALSGASMGQLAYWRTGRTAEPLLVPENYRPHSPVHYSFEDVIALRTFVYLRGRDIPLQRVRKAVRNLRRLGAVDHLSAYRLVPAGRDVIWVESEDQAHDLTGMDQSHPVLATMIDVLSTFVTSADRTVVDLRRPNHGIEVDRAVRGGYPVIEGTRVPYDAVASLIEDGVDLKDIGDFYPVVTPRSAEGAVEFAIYVSTYRNPSNAA
ncbi:Uncharacterized conserved protein, DUF433 family [Frankineae bacterium MT45]|nr:Uncharacterized conserved protein, DUF433 family [Frankineae bacterium MT45]